MLDTTWRGTWRVACLLAVLALAAGGCGGDGGDGGDGGGGGSTAPTEVEPPTGTDEGDGGGGNAAGVDPCSLLTEEELEAAFGVPLTAERDEQLSTDFQQVCSFSSADLTAGVQVLVIEPGPQADFDAQRETTEEVYDEPGAIVDVEVPGADRAFALEGVIIAMEIGDHYVQVANTSIGELSDPATTQELAALVAGRM